MQNQIRKEYESIKDAASLTELAAYFNKYSSTPVKRFSDKESAHRRIAALLAEIDTDAKVESYVSDPLAAFFNDEEAPAVAAKKPPKLYDVYKVQKAVAPAIIQKEVSRHTQMPAPLAKARAAGLQKEVARGFANGASPAKIAKTIVSKDDARRKMSEGQRESWKVAEIREKRCERSAVMVDRQQFKSVPAAFRELGLPMSKCIAFRMRLKEEGVIKNEFGHNWEIVPLNY